MSNEPVKQDAQSDESGAESALEEEHLETGIPRLDYILKGGLPRNRLHLLYGPTGSGKTVAANQFCFHQACEHGRRALYFTVAVESHHKIIAGVSSFDFYDSAFVGDEISYVSAYATLRDEGLVGLLELIRQSVDQHDADVVVLDGVQMVRDHVGSSREYRAWLHLFQSVLTMLDATGVLISTTPEACDQEAVVADGVIELGYQLVGPRFVREIIGYKLRGSDYLLGRHQVEITDAGMSVHPRLEVQFSEPPRVAHEERERMSFGSENLDEMLGGGVLSGSATALMGESGTGKTTLGLSFLAEGAKQGQPGMYFGFSEPPERLVERAEHVGIELAEHVESGLIEILWRPALEHFLDSLAESILDRFRRGPSDEASQESPRRSRLFVDGVDGFVASAVYKDRLGRFFAAFANQLRAHDVTSVFSENLAPGRFDHVDGLMLPIAESAIALQRIRRGARFHRLVSILKMRESDYDEFIHEFDITDNGFEVHADPTSAKELLDAHRAEYRRGGRA